MGDTQLVAEMEQTSPDLIPAFVHTFLLLFAAQELQRRKFLAAECKC
jgi:hypothetical protein